MTKLQSLKNASRNPAALSQLIGLWAYGHKGDKLQVDQLAEICKLELPSPGVVLWLTLKTRLFPPSSARIEAWIDTLWAFCHWIEAEETPRGAWVFRGLDAQILFGLFDKACGAQRRISAFSLVRLLVRRKAVEIEGTSIFVVWPSAED